MERELKVIPEDETLLDRLERVDALGPLRVRGRRRELQHNSFFDSASRALQHARIGFRRRTIDGASQAVWTVKGNGTSLRGVQTRDEIELTLSPDMPPALALSALQQAAAQHNAAPLADEIADALRSGGLPLAAPYLETETQRRIVDLEAGDTYVELALDQMRIVGHDYDETEIEAELKRGSEAVLDEVREAIEALGAVRDSDGSKLSRAAAHVRDCRCARKSSG